MTMPLSVYVHIPWCVRKCPYCDFNSHQVSGVLPGNEYVTVLLEDLAADIEHFGLQRGADTVFFGGGTPSLLDAAAVGRIIAGVKRRPGLSVDAEITLEANPGTVTGGARKFRDLLDAGVNRLSIGVQSFDDASLATLGRIHSAAEARAAYGFAREAGFTNVNLDLMHGLPGQDVPAALADLETAISLAPDHISWYQLTIEPNTVFYKRPPALPDEDTQWAIYEAGQSMLASAGYSRYEVSAFAREGRQCRHNVNYWRFGDYLGVGAGAHGKLTLDQGVVRTAKTRLPADYLIAPGRRITRVSPAELPVEFLMNALRLGTGFTREDFRQRTGLEPALLDEFLRRARSRHLVETDGTCIRPTALGTRFLDTLLVMAMEDGVIARSG